VGIYSVILAEDVGMRVTIVKWGNSQGIRIPKAFLKNIQVSENDSVDITLPNEKIIIRNSV
jgi:antitoxin MazE